MEKLQAALARARNQRDGRADQTKAPRRHQTGLPQTVPEPWEALEKVDLSHVGLRQHRIVAHDAGRGATNFDILRTKILMQMQQNGWTRLAITSPVSSSGKTTVACNLALGLGRQGNLRTMLFDFDLGDPSVHEFMGIERSQRLSDVLSGRVPLGDHAIRVRDNVAVVTSPEPEPDPTQFILSDRMETFLNTTQESYQPDIMIFDLPAILSGDRARAFLNTVDCALIVALAGRTKFSDLDACEREVAESTNVLGVVMNGCHPSAMPREDL